MQDIPGKISNFLCHCRGKKIEVSNLNQVQVIHQKFCEVHELAYGYASKSDPVEIINISLQQLLNYLSFHQKILPIIPLPPKADGERPVVFENPDKPTIAKCFNRASLFQDKRFTDRRSLNN